MSFLNMMKARYTTKKYDASKTISEENIDQLKQILRLSPSSINSQPWNFIFIEDTETKQKLSKVSWLNTNKVTDSHAVVVFQRIDDIPNFEAQIEAALPEGAVNYYKEFIKPKPEAEIKAWFDKQVYLAFGIFVAALAEMGIDSTPMEGIEPDNYDKIIANDGYKTLVAIAIGYRSPDDGNQPSKNPKSRLDLDKVVKTL